MTLCVFCGVEVRKSERSKEHILPMWLLKATGDPHRKIRIEFDPDSGADVIRPASTFHFPCVYRKLDSAILVVKSTDGMGPVQGNHPHASRAGLTRLGAWPKAASHTAYNQAALKLVSNPSSALLSSDMFRSEGAGRSKGPRLKGWIESPNALICRFGRGYDAHIIVLGEAQLRRILRSYARYYNDIRTHRSSEEKHEPASDIDTAVVDSLKGSG
jgi:hypothetical protein